MTYPYFNGGRILEGVKAGRCGLLKKAVDAYLSVMSSKAWYCVFTVCGGAFFIDALLHESQKKGRLSFGWEWLILLVSLALGFASLIAGKKRS